MGLIGATKWLLEHTEDTEYFRNSNKYSFVLVASAAMESLLNDGIISWAKRKFPQTDYKRHAAAFLSMTLGKKLDALGFLISSGIYLTDNTSKTYKTLNGLIKLRNEVAHSKDFYSTIDVELLNSEDFSQGFELPFELVEQKEKAALKLTPEQCKSIVNSLEELNSVLCCDISLEQSLLFKTIS